MEGEKIIEGLECLWFFSNVLSSPPPSISAFQGEISSVLISDSSETNNELESTSIIFRAQQVQAAYGEEKTQKGCPAMKMEERIVEQMAMGEVGSPELVMKRDQRSRNERTNHKKKCRTRRRTKGVKEQQKFRSFGFNDDFEGRMAPLLLKFQYSENPHLVSKIPPLKDGMAMKEHIKSWARDVACKVR